jgi:hypothetical protein
MRLAHAQLLARFGHPGLPPSDCRGRLRFVSRHADRHFECGRLVDRAVKIHQCEGCRMYLATAWRPARVVLNAYPAPVRSNPARTLVEGLAHALSSSPEASPGNRDAHPGGHPDRADLHGVGRLRPVPVRGDRAGGPPAPGPENPR